jgi:hypothetical protein
MKNTLVRIKKDKLPALPPRIAAGRYTWKDVDQWMSRLGASPIPSSERVRLRKAGLLGMPTE